MTIMDSFDIGSGALTAHGDRLQIHAMNMANLNTPNYVRKIPVIQESNGMTFESILGEVRSGGLIRAGIGARPTGVMLSGTTDDPTPGRRVYRPEHPAADKDGYITSSNSNPLNDMADALMSSRAFEANLAVVSIAKAMANRALEIGRGQ